MSDFDKEAEREKLREKYEHEQQNREATERMSDLLLKGATMTNAHCGTCGDPIFRHEGQEFCPTCQEVLTEDGETQPAESAAEPTPTDGPETGVDAASATDVSTGVETTEDADAEFDDGAGAQAPGQQPTLDRSQTSVESTHAHDQNNQARIPEPSGTGAESGDQSPTDAGGESLASARASLSRTVTRLARRAEASDDLERARAYLAATEEAADALAAVERADR